MKNVIQRMCKIRFHGTSFGIKEFSMVNRYLIYREIGIASDDILLESADGKGLNATDA